MSKTSDKPQIPAIPAPPRHLTRAEKAHFRRIAEQIVAAGKSVSATKVDAIADIVCLRSRIADTRRMYRHAVGKLRQNPDWHSDRSYALACSKQIDSQTARAQRMAAALGLSQEIA